MIIFVFLLAIITFSSMKKRKDIANVLSKKDTVTINGVFVILIFLSHSIGYLTLSTNILDSSYQIFRAIHDQWVVITFLSFSGYGVMYNIAKKENYVHEFFLKRIIKTLFNFDLAVLLYLLLNLVLDINYEWYDILLSFIGLRSIGNSNWYIFTILLMYLFTFIVAIKSKKPKTIASLVSLLSIAYIATGIIFDLPPWFVNTVLCYPFGMWLYIYHDNIIKIIKNKSWISILTLLVPVVLTTRYRSNYFIMNLLSCLIVLICCFVLCFVEFESKILTFLGRHAFSIYILQRIPMIFISKIFNYKKYFIGNYLFVIVSFIITLIIAVLFDKLIKLLDSKFFNN